MGLSASDVYTALQLMLAPVYANDFIYQGRVLRVLLQADASWRMTPACAGSAAGSDDTFANGASGPWEGTFHAMGRKS